MKMENTAISLHFDQSSELTMHREAIRDKERPEKKDVAPIADPELCILCGTCAEGCPSGAIDIDEVVQTDPKTCILCHACVKNCPTAAIAFQAPPLQELSQKLSRECQVRQEPEIYLPMG